MQIRTDFQYKLKYQRFAASSWQDHKHILTLDEIPEQVSILKSQKIQNLMCIVLCKPLTTRLNSQPFTASFVFVAVLSLKTGFVATQVHYCRVSVRLFLLGKNWHWLRKPISDSVHNHKSWKWDSKPLWPEVRIFHLSVVTAHSSWKKNRTSGTQGILQGVMPSNLYRTYNIMTKSSIIL